MPFDPLSLLANVGGQVAERVLGQDPIGAVLGGLFGGSAAGKKPKAIQYKPTYAAPYTYDPYAFAPGEQGLYQNLMGEIMRGSNIQERGATRSMAEELNRRGLGASSVYQAGRSNIAGEAQARRALEMGEAERQKFGLHESRAESQRGRQHEWSMGPGVSGQRETIAARGQHAQNVNQMMSQYTQPFFSSLSNMAGGGGGATPGAGGSGTQYPQQQQYPQQYQYPAGPYQQPQGGMNLPWYAST
jgi:hypothetical protein